ncbi:class 1 fructose-bisphosphatase [Chondromyces apiculatus]|uniref:Fructose-1,6-bisphosphatase class 1 n=1 Tax=Chondromyces apiculatus DSM 436 TaxID=1192034 RepID=A0A017SUJ6_9BACT|nr:class 1 fructose-bisphosphatase [Chondromyces apiculatus]EYF00285.1 Fructose-1,6-bisphosphatase, type I [Chondromyces apiculatus DSM 436]
MATASDAQSTSSHSLQPSISRVGITLEAYILEGMIGLPGATGAFTSLLNQIGLTAKLITSKVRRAGLANILGYTGETNVQGEQVQKLDEVANETLLNALGRRGHCAAVASEELEELRILSTDPRARYLVVTDPLDGSSNIDVNISIGTIFGILRKAEDKAGADISDFMRPGHELLAAGYILYGSSTMLVITTAGSGVHGFTYDPTVGEFFLSHENIRIPERGAIYSINEGNSARWTEGVRRWNAWVKEEDKATGRPYACRYVGSLVADAHRTLLKGGIFAYPADQKSKNGKLRLLYEANPYAFIFEAAGGRASTGTERILDITPTELHQRVPLVLGSPHDVEIFEEFVRGAR